MKNLKLLTLAILASTVSMAAQAQHKEEGKKYSDEEREVFNNLMGTSPEDFAKGAQDNMKKQMEEGDNSKFFSQDGQVLDKNGQPVDFSKPIKPDTFFDKPTPLPPVKGTGKYEDLYHDDPINPNKPLNAVPKTGR